MREGFAHFAAVWTYNRPNQSDGFIRWFNTTYDVEFNNPHLSGGFIENNCGGTVDGQGTNLDAMRLYWDWSTPTTASHRATRADVMNTYEGMADAPAARHQYFVYFYLDASANLSTTQRNNLWSYGCWNGLIPQNLCGQ